MEKHKLIKQWSQDLEKYGFDNKKDWRYLTRHIRKNLNIRVPRMVKRQTNFLTLAEYKQLLEKALEMQNSQQTKDRGLIIETIIKSGLEIKQLINLKIQNINFDYSTKASLFKLKLKRQDYYGLFPKSLTIKLKEQIKDRNKGYLFLNKKGKQYSIRSIQLILKHVKNDCKINKLVTPKTLKNIFGTILLEEGIDKSFLQNFKKDTTNIISIYMHILKEEIRK